MTDAPNTARPTENLEYEQEPTTLIDVRSVERFADTPAVLTAFSRLLEVADEAGIYRIEHPHPGAVTVSIQKTDEELRLALAGRQHSYDVGREDYQTWLDTGQVPKYRYALDMYLQAEGLDPGDVIEADDVVDDNVVEEDEDA